MPSDRAFGSAHNAAASWEAAAFFILDNPSAYIDSQNWFSWEQYFTALLTGKSQNTPYAYSKKRLNPVFLKGKICEQILQSLPDALRVLLQR